MAVIVFAALCLRQNHSHDDIQRESQFATTTVIFRTPVSGVILLLHVQVMLYCTISALTNQIIWLELTVV